ncbi:hypothetical protein GC167_04770 [bacterium]|nr:hypothetical protein [bacterium]
MSTDPRHLLGQKGEEAAERYLRDLGYAILERNWRHGHWEVDLIARDGDWLVLVEVKTRSGHFRLEDALGPQKQRVLVEAAEVYADQIGFDGHLRFDMIAIVTGPPEELVHLPHAFLPDPEF